MLSTRNLFSRKHTYLYIVMICMLAVAVLMAFNNGDGNDFDLSKREVLLRKIAHELLLQSGDSTSRVLPVEKMSENEYRIRFEKDFGFVPDSLVDISRRVLAADTAATDYTVSVLSCDSPAIAYAYTLSENKKEDVVPCKGRRQPKACYVINIKFKPESNNAMAGYILGGLPVLALTGFILFRRKPKKTPPGEKPAGTLDLGNTSFYVQQRQLLIDGNTIDLTTTEARLLLIFAQSPNQTIERSRLQKEIWEDEGVIVGRSLDMFISKLRKKLEADPDISIVVVRGKGYKLEVG
ncbi:winged helix-turn-helix domain-containing protein [Flavobacterium sp. MFBS3-15]|uniref:winged helix-turn-helix domain-containing protein n=1 Tax=Flavobacterium sp. MFBS3-15 TaxID=2989816 RepID=UPI0022367A4C|nr:winged helix-turn-helix domain-containing protein [Flavobacterium sp. MFBS3-15]MCW4468094.1 winged helix-turn-helix domain-containing protein [Flavobacterium sp. MFBS3-15]